MAREYEGSLWTIDRFVSGYANNAFLVTCRSTGQSIIIDTPDAPHELIEAASKTRLEAILITHGHWDHVQGFEEVTGRFPAPVGIGKGDASAIEGHGAARRVDVSEGAVIRAGDVLLRAIPTPGHTPGSTCYMLPAESPGAAPHVFTGDTLFPGGPGKSSSPEALDQIIQSITSRLYTLPGDTAVLPGHGGFTTIRASKKEYEAFASRPRRPGLHGDVTWSGGG